MNDRIAGALSAFVLAMFLLAGNGCGFPASLAKAHEGLKGMSQVVEPVLADACLKRAKKCADLGIESPDKCEPLQNCRKLKAAYVLGAKEVHHGLARCNSVYHELKKEGLVK